MKRLWGTVNLRKIIIAKKCKKILWKIIMNILQLNLGSFSHIMAPAAILLLLQLHIGSCSHILALELYIKVLQAPSFSNWILKRTPCFWSSFAAPQNTFFFFYWSGFEIASWPLALLGLLGTFLEPGVASVLFGTIKCPNMFTCIKSSQGISEYICFCLTLTNDLF